MTQERLLILAAGGTILKKQHGQKMEWSVDLSELVRLADKEIEFEIQTVYHGLAASFRLETVIEIAQNIESSKQKKIVITLGTDVLEEVAFALSHILGSSKTVVITASMKPYGRDGYEGIANLRDAISLAKNSTTEGGVYVVMNEQIFSGKNVFKYHSSRPDAFRGYPGAIGEMLSGLAVLRPPEESQGISRLSEVSPKLVGRINIGLIWTHMDMSLDNYLLSRCDGLVIAAMGAGSVPSKISDKLAEKWTEEIPIVISTRCPIGPNHAESMYTGSVEKYTNRGFLVREFTGLNPLQTRMKMHLDIAMDCQGIETAYWIKDWEASRKKKLK